jgi:flagellar basal-body rod protein FlgB
MDFNKPIDPMNGTSEIMDLIAKKQKYLGENLANMDTPGYVRKDLNFGQYLNSSVSGNLETKLSEKFGFSPVFDEQGDGKVNAANELMELQKNSILYSMATRRMSSIITEMKTAVNVGK